MSAVKTANLARDFMTHIKVFSQRDTLDRSRANRIFDPDQTAAGTFAWLARSQKSNLRIFLRVSRVVKSA